MQWYNSYITTNWEKCLRTVLILDPKIFCKISKTNFKVVFDQFRVRVLQRLDLDGLVLEKQIGLGEVSLEANEKGQHEKIEQFDKSTQFERVQGFEAKQSGLLKFKIVRSSINDVIISVRLLPQELFVNDATQLFIISTLRLGQGPFK